MKRLMLLAFLSGLLAAGAAPSAFGQPKQAPKATDLEIAQLPPYCQARLRADRAQMDLWSQRLGRDNTIHIHHFCHGLLFFNRAAHAQSDRERREYLNGTIRQMDYVLNRWPADFPLYVEAATYKQQAETLRSLR